MANIARIDSATRTRAGHITKYGFKLLNDTDLSGYPNVIATLMFYRAFTKQATAFPFSVTHGEQFVPGGHVTQSVAWAYVYLSVDGTNALLIAPTDSFDIGDLVELIVDVGIITDARKATCLAKCASVVVTSLDIQKCKQFNTEQFKLQFSMKQNLKNAVDDMMQVTKDASQSVRNFADAAVGAVERVNNNLEDNWEDHKGMRTDINDLQKRIASLEGGSHDEDPTEPDTETRVVKLRSTYDDVNISTNAAKMPPSVDYDHDVLISIIREDLNEIVQLRHRACFYRLSHPCVIYYKGQSKTVPANTLLYPGLLTICTASDKGSSTFFRDVTYSYARTENLDQILHENIVDPHMQDMYLGLKTDADVAPSIHFVSAGCNMEIDYGRYYHGTHYGSPLQGAYGFQISSSGSDGGQYGTGVPGRPAVKSLFTASKNTPDYVTVLSIQTADADEHIPSETGTFTSGTYGDTVKVEFGAFTCLDAIYEDKSNSQSKTYWPGVTMVHEAFTSVRDLTKGKMLAPVKTAVDQTYSSLRFNGMAMWSQTQYQAKVAWREFINSVSDTREICTLIEEE